MEGILQQLGLANLLSRFVDERVDEKIVLSSTDSELSRLGISTIGDRVRLRELCKQSVQAGQGQGASAATASHEVRELFHSNRRGSKRGTKQAKKRTWTAQVVCLADRLAYKVPTASEKQILFKAGLGLKRIKFDVDDNEEAVVKKITASETEDGSVSAEVLGFPQLHNCGGFELMRCVANCRELVVIDGSWAVKELKANGGTQAKIYVRPIQKSLSTKPLAAEKTSQVKEKCISCDKELFVHELRKHSFVCADMFNTSEGSEGESDLGVLSTLDEMPDPSVNLEVQVESLSSSSSTPAPSNDTPYTTATNILTSTDSTLGNSASAPINVHPDESDLDTQEKIADHIVAELVQYCSANDISNPVEILSCYQSMFVQGRALEIKDPSVCEEGVTNVIFIDRGNVLDTGFDEADLIQNLRTTLEVEFYGEVQ